MIKLKDILLEQLASEVRKRFRNYLVYVTGTTHAGYGKNIRQAIEKNQDEKLLKFFQNLIESWEKRSDIAWPNIEDYRGPEFKLVFRTSLEQGIDEFQRLKKDLDKAFKKLKQDGFGSKDPNMHVWIDDHLWTHSRYTDLDEFKKRAEEHYKKRVERVKEMWFGFGDGKLSWKDMADRHINQLGIADYMRGKQYKTFMHYLDEFFDRMSMYE